MISTRELIGLPLAVGAATLVSGLIDRLRGDEWDVMSDMLVSLFAATGAYLFVRGRAGQKF